MKSIKYLLIALITLLLYQSDFPKTFAEFNVSEWVFLVFFTIFFWYGNYIDVDKN